MGTRFLETEPRPTPGDEQQTRPARSIRWRRWHWVGLLAFSLVPLWIVAEYFGLAFVGLMAIVSAPRSRHQANVSIPGDTTVLVGKGATAVALAAAMSSEPIYQHPSMSTFPRRREHFAPARLLHAHSVEEAMNVVPNVNCDKVVVVDPRLSDWKVPADARGQVPEVVSSVGELARVLGRLPIEMVSLDPGITGNEPIRPLNRSYASSKRCLDLVVAVPVALVGLVLLPLIALAIRLDSPGPIFYSQTRVGLGGRLFRIHKLRSMRQDAEANGVAWARVNDDRITPIGRLMRSTRIDELPQVWNIIRGDMSLVGPRPERPEFTAILEKQLPGFSLRTQVKPGLTGWAQTSAGYSRSIHDSRTKLEYDLFYVAHGSMLFDLRILLRTIPVVIARKGS